MTLLGIALPLVSGHTPSPPDRAAYQAVAYTTIALFLGGFLAPRLSRRWGLKSALVTLLGLRSFALLSCSFLVADETATTCTLALVLFGHGFGFAILPGLIKKDGDPSVFCREYGTVLVAWGLAGFLGGWVNVASVEFGMGYAGSLGFCGIVTGLSAVVLSRSRLADDW
jgi:predicted MFS family arabinose efflux permease